MIIAPRDLYGVDAVGVRRRVRAGTRIPPGLLMEEPVTVRVRVPELDRLAIEKARRARLAATREPEEDTDDAPGSDGESGRGAGTPEPPAAKAVRAAARKK